MSETVQTGLDNQSQSGAQVEGNQSNTETQQNQESSTSLLSGNATNQEGNDQKAGTNSEEKNQTGEADKTKVVPEKYEFKVPEGLELDTVMVEQFTPIAKELGLSNDQAQKLVDIYANQVVTQQKANMEAWHQTFQTWATATKTDAEIGGEKIESSVKNAKNALDKYGSTELKAMLEPFSQANPKGLGLGNHPELIRLLARIGAAMGEDQTHIKTEPPRVLADKAKLMFPGMK